jgi:CBS domain-containing protein
MLHAANVLGRLRVKDLTHFLKDRKIPVIHEKADLEDVIEAMAGFAHSRLLYVINDNHELIGTISLGLLERHFFSGNHEPQIHARLMMKLIMAETAGDIMQKNLVVTREEDELVDVLQKMIQQNIKEMPVINRHHKVIGDLTLVDLLKFIVDLKKHNLPDE